MKKIILVLYVLIIIGEINGQVIDGLVGHFPFTNGDFTDLAGYQDCVLSINGDSIFFLTEDRFENSNYAIDFQGAVLNSGIISRDVTTEVTVSLWMKTTAVPEDVQFLVNKYYCVEPPLGYHMAFQGDSVTFDGRDNSSNGYMRSGWSETFVNDGEWHHIVGLVRAEGIWELWVDSQQEGSNSYSSIFTLNHNYCNLGIAGPDQINEIRIYKGALDDIRLYNRALDSLEIDSLFNEPNPITSGFSDLANRSLNLNIYPVPASDFINLKTFGKNKIKQVVIYNSLGIQVSSHNYISKRIWIEYLPDGIYFLNAITTAGVIETQKFSVKKK